MTPKANSHLGISPGSMSASDFFKKWLAWRAGYYAVNRRLSGFAYHVDLELTVFLIASLIALLIAWATILSYSYKVSGAKPAMALRYE